MQNENIGLGSDIIKFLKEKTIDKDLPIFLEPRSGERGIYPYGYSSNDNEIPQETYIEIKDDEKEKIIDVAGKFATSGFGIQILVYMEIKGKKIDYYTCGIDFIDEYANKEEFLKSISFLSNAPSDFIEKIKSDICSQVDILFPKIS
ncbi:hypothetical protein V6665_00495 (plasmid) [Campylobacter fetus]|uniref:hypothetical protein n=1 Tax=Campylobacter fetus TaxID=196 RepID=UPI00055417CF|nr:hypothetical protein [Campylobacter fetus]OCS23609.1 hypothetical protein CFVI9825_08070 [Campylobacter fetus subsp. venerealis cfvi9825]